MLADGTYDAFVIDARIEEPADADAPRVVHLELTITAGDHKGDVVSLTSAGLDGEEFELIGMPATLTVTAGTPEITIDA